MPTPLPERLSSVRLADGSPVTFGEDGTPLARRMNGDQLWAAATAAGELTQVVDGVEERLPPDPDVVVGGVSGHDALLARQQCQAVARVHAGKRSTAAPAVVRRTAPRARGAGRPAVRSTSRSSSGDDSDPGEPPPALAGPSPRFSRPWRLAVEARVADLLGGSA